jgi:hypothetical protein
MSASLFYTYSYLVYMFDPYRSMTMTFGWTNNRVVGLTADVIIGKKYTKSWFDSSLDFLNKMEEKYVLSFFNFYYKNYKKTSFVNIAWLTLSVSVDRWPLLSSHFIKFVNFVLHFARSITYTLQKELNWLRLMKKHSYYYISRRWCSPHVVRL